MEQEQYYPEYRYDRRVMLSLARDALLGRQRSFRIDALKLVKGISCLRYIGEKPEPVDGRGLLITMNHYYRAGFGSWWVALALSAALPVEIHWTMASQWRDLRGLRRWTVTPASKTVFQRLARVYGFTCLPPMPPDPAGQAERATAVRVLVRAARRASQPVIGFAPEGMDTPEGGLMQPHSGVGRLMAHLAGLGMDILPVGVWEQDGCLVLHFGRPYLLEMDPSAPPAQLDQQVSCRVMETIADLLPEKMRTIVPAHW